MPESWMRMHRIELGGVVLLPHLSGALHVPELSALIISDLHLEQGTALARRGIRVPPYDTHLTLLLLEEVIGLHRPERLIFLGDSFHDTEGEASLEPDIWERLSAITKAHDCFWISGNHDPHPPQRLAGHAADHIYLGPLLLRHEPRKLGEDEFEISGHLHPGCAIAQRGRRVSGKCFAADARRLIMPAFGAYTGALSVLTKPFAGLFDHDAAGTWLLGRDRIYRFPFTRLA